MQALFAGGVTPDLVLSPRPFGELLRRSDEGWAPSFRLSITRARSGAIETARGSATLTWTAIRAEGCPHRVPLFTDTHLSPCAFADAGTLRGEGKGVSDPRGETLGWVAPGVLVRLDQELFRVLVLEVQAGVFIPLNRAKFFFEPDPVIYETPSVGAEAAVATGFRFP